MHRADGVTAAAFAALGAYLVASGGGFPAGAGGLPGAGFFPQTIGALMVVLALGLFFKARQRGGTAGFAFANAAQTAGAAGMLLVYLALWGTGFFPLRTVLFLTLLLKFLGQRWRSAAGAALVLTTLATAAFQYGLNVSLE